MRQTPTTGADRAALLFDVRFFLLAAKPNIRFPEAFTP
jgi:hypothetical protein